MRVKIRWVVAALLLGSLTAQANNYDDVADYRNLTTNNLPHLQVVIQKAMDYSYAGPMSTLKMKKKIRWSNLLPTVEVRYGQNKRLQNEYGTVTATDDRFYPEVPLTSGSANRYEGEREQHSVLNQSEEWRPYWQAYAEWDLNKLFYNRDATYMRLVKEQQMFYQQRTVKEVIKLHVELQDLLEQRGDQENIKLEIKISAVSVKLDFLTNDYLSAVILASPVKAETIVVNDKTAIASATVEPTREVVDQVNPDEGKEGVTSREQSEELLQFIESLNADGGSFQAQTVE